MSYQIQNFTDGNPLFAEQLSKMEQGIIDAENQIPLDISKHNTDSDSHPYIRMLILEIKTKLNAFFDTDDSTLDELSEIVAYITSNKDLIDAITTSKVSVSDIVDNLTTNVSNKPLSAAQGVVLKGLIDTLSASLSKYALASAIPTRVSQLYNDSGFLTEHQDISGKLDADKLPEAINTALAQAKASGEFDGAVGKDGQNGTNGKDGVSPTVSVTTITGGHRITITDANETKTVDVMNGSDGQDGQDGSNGKDGVNGKDGKDGNGIKSAVLNADYTLTLTFDDGTSYTTPSIRGATGGKGDKGDTGSSGKNGTSATHSWNGTTLTITSASGTSSANLVGSQGEPGKNGTSVTVSKVSESSVSGGSNVVAFSDGKTLTVKNGKDGGNGKTPVKGVDYWTAADQESIVQDVLTALGTPVFGRVDENNNIILTGELANGTYTLKYEDVDGNVTEIGTLDTTPAPTYINRIPLSTEVDGVTLYNGGKGYKENTRWSKSGGGDVSATGVTVSGYIPVKPGDVIRIKNITMNKNAQASNVCNVCYFWSLSATDGASADSTSIANDFSGIFDANGNLTQFTIPASLHPTYIRLNTGYIGSDSILTINEPIE